MQHTGLKCSLWHSGCVQFCSQFISIHWRLLPQWLGGAFPCLHAVFGEYRNFKPSPPKLTHHHCPTTCTTFWKVIKAHDSNKMESWHTGMVGFMVLRRIRMSYSCCTKAKTNKTHRHKRISHIGQQAMNVSTTWRSASLTSGWWSSSRLSSNTVLEHCYWSCGLTIRRTHGTGNLKKHVCTISHVAVHSRSITNAEP